MPGRQSTRHAPRQPSQKPRKSKLRGLDALAIAEQENPTKVKIRRHRLGEDFGDRSTRHGEALNSDEDATRSEERPSKRRRTDTANSSEDEDGSDSDGNYWRIGADNGDDDSDLDSDEAMGESDEDRFEDFRFRGSSSSKPRKQGVQKIHSEEEMNADTGLDLSEGQGDFGGLSEAFGSDDEDEEDLGEGAVDLATALDMNEEDEGPDRRYSSPRNTQRRKEFDDAVGSDTESDDSAEDSEGSRLSISEDEDEKANQAGLSKLRDFISAIQDIPGKDTTVRSQFSVAQEQRAPSDFGLPPSQKLKVADLLSTVTDPSLKKSLKLLSSSENPATPHSKHGVPGKLATPLPKRLQDRLDRKAAYEKSKETLNRWVETVKHNRRAEHLSFPLVDQDTFPVRGTKRFVSTTASKPVTDLEETIQVILQESGLQGRGKNEEAQLQAAEELEENKLPFEEVQARRAELRRRRDLLFREEVRAKRIKKIRSKSYRRVHRKERQRGEKKEREALAAAGIELSEGEQELNDRRRAEERMSARHRSSRWAKGVKVTGRAVWDESARDGVAEMAQKAEELRRRIEGKRVTDPDDNYLGPSSSESDGESNIEDHDMRKEERQLARLSKTNDSTAESGLMSMKFMQKAEAARKAANDADIERLRRDMNDEATSSDEEPEETGRRRYGQQQALTLPGRVSNTKASEFEEKLAPSDEERDDAAVLDEGAVPVDRASRPKKAFDARTKTVLSTNKDNKITTTQNPPTSNGIASNPWLSERPQDIKDRKRSTNAVNESDNKNDDAAIIIPDFVQEPSNPKPSKSRPKSAISTSISHSSPTSPSSSSPEPPNLLHKNAALVAAAFAGDNVLSTFSHEKSALASSEDEHEISTSLPGWGSWTGAGISKKQQKRHQYQQQQQQQQQQRLRKDPQSQAPSLTAKSNNNNNNGSSKTGIPGVKPSDRRDANLPNVAISEKRVRKTSKYLAPQLPYPFESRIQYERSLRVPVGPEWTTKHTYQEGIKPRVLVKKGRVIGAMETPMA